MNSTSATCIILAGGMGTRLRSAVSDRPKCLAPVGNRTFLEIQIEMLIAQGMRRLVVSLGYGSEQVLDVLKPLKLIHSIETVVEATQLGTGGALLYAMHVTGLEEAFSTNGDTYLNANLSAMHNPLKLKEGERMRVAAVVANDRWRFGGLDLRQNNVVGFLAKESRGPGPINAGFYRIHRDAFDGRLPLDVFSLENETMPSLVSKNGLRAELVVGDFIDIGIPIDYHRFCEDYGESS